MNDQNNNTKQEIVIFFLDEMRYALNLSVVNRILSAVEITLLPKAPDIVLGIINFHSAIIPVINVRKRFRLPEKVISIDDQLIIAQTSKRSVALLVDSVEGVYSLENHQILNTAETFPFFDYLSGIVTLENDIILIHDLEKFLSLEEEDVLDKALGGGSQ